MATILHKMIPIVNKEDVLIKSYLEIREQVIEAFKLSLSENDKYDFKTTWLREVETNGNIDSLVTHYDNYLMSSKLTDKGKRLLTGYDSTLTVVEHDFIIHEHRYGTLSFKTDEERFEWLTMMSKNNVYDAFEVFDVADMKEWKGTLDDNYDMIVDMYENVGCECFIKVDSIFSTNIKIGFIQ